MGLRVFALIYARKSRCLWLCWGAMMIIARLVGLVFTVRLSWALFGVE